MSLAARVEAHSGDVTALVFHEGRLYSGGDDGKIKVWNDDLTGRPQEVQAHPVNVNCLAALNDTIYSSSNDGTIKAWSRQGDSLAHRQDLINYDNEVEVLYAYKDTLYAGDDKGSVGVFKRDKLALIFNLLEEVKDLIVDDNLMYTVRDLDITVTEFLSEENTRYMTRQTLEGKSPMCLAADKLCFAGRCGKTLVCHHNCKRDNFRQLDSVQAHDMIINSMCSMQKADDDEVVLCTGGWDKTLKIWTVNREGKISLDRAVDIGVCINKVCFGRSNQVYIGGSDGVICRVDF